MNTQNQTTGENQDITCTICALNDAFRSTLQPALGQVFITSGISSLSDKAVRDIAELVKAYARFEPDNGPYGEHDFGSLDYQGMRVFWKIDYYNQDLTGGSENPADPAHTKRVLTIMLAEEY